MTSAFLKECPAKEKLESRLKELYNFERFSCPFRRGDWIFFFRNSGLQNQSVLYKQRGFDGKEEELLDPNRLSDDGTAALGTYGLTESGSMLAYGVSQSGSDWQTISVINVADGSKLKDELNWVKFSGVSWTHDEKVRSTGKGGGDRTIALRAQQLRASELWLMLILCVSCVTTAGFLLLSLPYAHGLQEIGCRGG